LKTLVLCIGNELFGDDGVALHVGGLLRKLVGEEVGIEESSGIDLVEKSLGYKRIIVIDSIIDPENVGEIKRLGLEDIKKEGLFAHSISLYQLLRIAERAEGKKEIMVYAICIASMELGMKLTDKVKKSAEGLAKELSSLLGH
jgi:hydrogenase maturation protease